MLDLLFILATVAFFGVAVLYVYGCDWFIKENHSTNPTEYLEITRERTEPV